MTRPTSQIAPRLGDFTTTPRVLIITLLAVPVGALSAGVAWLLLRLIGLITNGLVHLGYSQYFGDVATGVLIDIALSPTSPGANADASAVAVALALHDALAESPPRNLDVELAVAGAGDGRQLGMQGYVRARRRTRRAEEVAVLALGPCGAGRPRFFVTEGLLFPLRLHPRLIALAGATAAREAHLKARPAARGLTGALPARAARWPAISVACLDDDDRAPRARQPADDVDAVDPKALHATLEFCLALIAALDDDLQDVQSTSRVTGSVR